MIRRLRRDEGGWTLVTAIALMSMMMGIGAVTMSTVDTQQKQSGSERVKESTFNLAEAALSSQAFQLVRRWPGKPTAVMPTNCYTALPATTGPATGDPCPDFRKLASAYSGGDYAAGDWVETIARDNGGSSERFYNDATTPNEARYDVNADGRMWVRARARVGGRIRTLVALVRIDQQVVPFPEQVLVAGRLTSGNSGNKVLIDTKGDASQPVEMSVRCAHNATGQTPGCVEIERGGRKQQISPDTLNPNPFPTDTAIPQEQIDLLRDQADADNTLFSYCPSFETLAALPPGSIVYLEGVSCTFQGNGEVNTHEIPGMLVLDTGSLTLRGNVVFHGIVYALNLLHDTSVYVDLSGDSYVDGAVFVDWAGGVLVTGSSPKIVYNKNTFKDTNVNRDGGVVRSTWRELPSSQE
jgi:hypothetical protein